MLEPLVAREVHVQDQSTVPPAPATAREALVTARRAASERCSRHAADRRDHADTLRKKAEQACARAKQARARADELRRATLDRLDHVRAT